MNSKMDIKTAPPETRDYQGNSKHPDNSIQAGE